MRLAGAGKNIGLSASQVLGLSAALSSVGLKAELGGTAMSRVFLEMKKATEKGGELLDSYAQIAQMSSEKFKETMEKNSIQAIVAFIKGLKNLESGAKILALEDLKIKGIRVIDVLLRASNATNLFERALESSSVAFKENNALAKEAGIFFETFNSRVQDMQNHLFLAGESGFKAMEGHLRQTMRLISQVSDNFRRLPESTSLS